MTDAERKEKNKIKQRLYRERNKESLRLAYQDDYQKRKTYFRNRYVKKKDQIASKQKKYRANNPTVYKDWLAKNKDRIKEYKKNWAKKNKLRLNNERGIRRKKDPHFKIATSLRSSLLHRLKEKKKSISALTLLSCSIYEFKSYIESKFKKDMTWDNHGKYGWHLDHIIPCSSFNLEEIDQQKQCFHYTNFQPLWWRDNLSKGNKQIGK